MSHEIDRIGNGINHDHSAFHKAVRFCPRCSVRALLRHERRVTREGKPIRGAEFWCTACGFSFNIMASVDWNLALDIFRAHRQLRTIPRLNEKHVAPDVVEAWK